MQTFLPLPSYADSVRTIDPRRLGNQVYRECMTLIRGGWPNHPASKMWRGHTHHLALYALAGLHELAARGKRYPVIEQELLETLERFPNTGPPPWLGDPDFHAAHRSNLLRKNPVWYGQFGWTEPPDLPYVWPTVPQVIHIPPALPFTQGRKLK